MFPFSILLSFMLDFPFILFLFWCTCYKQLRSPPFSFLSRLRPPHAYPKVHPLNRKRTEWLFLRRELKFTLQNCSTSLLPQKQKNKKTKNKTTISVIALIDYVRIIWVTLSYRALVFFLLLGIYTQRKHF